MVGQASCLSVQARCLHYQIQKRYFSNSHVPYDNFFLVERFFQIWDELYKEFLTIWTPTLESEIVAWAERLAPGKQGKDEHSG